ncbi:ADP-ribosylglycohydrolase family protein [Trichocoleus sp. FACHB-262]|uniref:ADP-ribosylglycohydrolase family protein n=1 Tax=Trichocoleus sp. FACHB-262 TaxID=2692869 RepID=UPI0016868777|nr:ADP-ribosylglycohydrolase family protein [Trichocoleus sp. FACHB-262]MBD2122951.1 ADP-ribosylglycohydrolase family protein [Trichocoleus sp. FACHB-262]
MRYSLLSQFQGVLVGAAIGELLGVAWATHLSQPDQSELAQPQLFLGHPERQAQQLLASEPLSLSAPAWGRLTVLGARSLVERGELDLADWQQRFQSDVELGHPEGLGAEGLAIASLPIALFFHEDETKLYRKLSQLYQCASLPPSSVLSSAVLANFVLSLAIAQALQNQLQPQELIPQIINALTRLEAQSADPIADSETIAVLMQQLAQVQTLIQQNASLEMARSQLCQPLQDTALPNAQFISPMMAALYCCLATPQDWHLAVLRSLQMKISPQLVATLTGALAGAYNSLAGIPVGWRLALDRQHSGISTLKSIWQVVESEAEVIELATHLLATWSGTYDTQKFPVKRCQVPAIAAPRVIRPR